MNTLSIFTLLLFVLAIPSAAAESELYWTSFGIYPSKDATRCAFLSAYEPESQQIIANFRPSVKFMKTACLHFNATWQDQVPLDGSGADYRIAVWRKESPDAPAFLSQGNM